MSEFLARQMAQVLLILDRSFDAIRTDLSSSGVLLVPHCPGMQDRRTGCRKPAGSFDSKSRLK